MLHNVYSVVWLFACLQSNIGMDVCVYHDSYTNLQSYLNGLQGAALADNILTGSMMTSPPRAYLARPATSSPFGSAPFLGGIEGRCGENRLACPESGSAAAIQPCDGYNGKYSTAGFQLKLAGAHMVMVCPRLLFYYTSVSDFWQLLF